jgi:hypothetical protein
VFSICDKRWGETPCTVVCVKPEAAVAEKELVDLYSVHLGNYKRPGKGRDPTRRATQDAGWQNKTKGASRALFGAP